LGGQVFFLVALLQVATLTAGGAPRFWRLYLMLFFLLLVTGGIGWEAVQRFLAPSSVEGSTIIGVAAVGIAINTATALMFLSGRDRDLNIRGAFLHMAADAVVSLGVVLAGIAILTTGQWWFDPVVSLIIVAVIIFGTWQLLQDSINLALDGVPPGIELVAVRTYLEQLEGVTEVHDLHIWAMSTTETALTVHLVMPRGCPNDYFLSQLCSELHNLFDIDHATIQVETGDRNFPCTLAPHHRV
jgi:cobalt-zinc-cadmium efflux system protein